MTTRTAKPPRSKLRSSPMEHPRHQYPQETAALQQIAGSCGLTEKIKWGKPCFTLADRNIVLIQRFNSYIALLFFQGSLLKDPEKRLVRISDNMEVPRQLRFTHVGEITALAATIQAYIEEAIELERAGIKPKPRPRAELALPDELRARLEQSPALKSAFESLTPGRQKAYIFHIAGAKQSSTRASRVEKNASRILAGKGLND